MKIVIQKKKCKRDNVGEKRRKKKKKSEGGRE